MDSRKLSRASYLAQDQEAYYPEKPGEQPQGNGLQVNRALGTRRLRGQRGALGRRGAGQPGDLALDRGRVGMAPGQAQHCLGERLRCRPVRLPEGRGGPDGGRPGIEPGRELGRRGLDPDDVECERRGPALPGRQHDAQGVPWFQLPRLRQQERDNDLIGPARIGEPPGDDLLFPEAARDQVVFRGEQVDVVRGQQADRPDVGHLHARQAGEGLAPDGGKVRRVPGNHQVGRLAPGQEAGVGGIGPPGTGGRGRDHTGERADEQGHAQPAAPASAQLGQEEEAHPCHCPATSSTGRA